ncbi:hypothetical protein FIU87_13950 [Bacillus sp. THAF10]|uniref:SA1362 family protein n=1 Tax=Bacillus sp. THAF10 TaxID=2587848 RepID=UPI0012685BD8|nr:SA1362 family protein [Bacillus sp. THAF10]QFT89761.1 hypothetical protein FIU87_13950 [Bacillus sp. THAF10]
MKRSLSKSIFYVLASLAAFALIIQLIKNPGDLFTSLLLIIGGVTVFYLIFRYFIQGRLTGGGDARYSKAVKQSKKRYGTNTTSAAQRQSVSPIKERVGSKPATQKRKAPSHLTVIEGKKGKKKNRAFF